ncbi:20387_t:CDS:2 [Gigaspora rosea]|nr:20387_t:CDS:2 [Gigaspora rosea]
MQHAMQVLNCGSIENSKKPNKTIASISRYNNNSRRATKISYSQELFLVVQKFEMEQSMTMGWNGSVLYLNALIQGSIYKMQDINYKTINERKLYGEAWGKARTALAVTVRRRNYNFIAILDKYLDDCQEVLSSNSDSDASSDNEFEADNNISNKKLNPKELTNSYKHKARG